MSARRQSRPLIFWLRAQHGGTAILQFGPSCAALVEGARVIHRLEIFTGLFRRPKIESVGKVTQQTYCRAWHAPAPLLGKCAYADSRLAIRLFLCRVTEGRPPLADIFVQCPRTGTPISTGLKSEWVLLKSLPRVPIPVRCPACRQIHKWMPQDAWMDVPSSAPRLSSSSRAAS
jgi:hypothetical protein